MPRLGPSALPNSPAQCDGSQDWLLHPGTCPIAHAAAWQPGWLQSLCGASKQADKWGELLGPHAGHQPGRWINGPGDAGNYRSGLHAAAGPLPLLTSLGFAVSLGSRARGQGTATAGALAAGSLGTLHMLVMLTAPARARCPTRGQSHGTSPKQGQHTTRPAQPRCPGRTSPSLHQASKGPHWALQAAA